MPMAKWWCVASLLLCLAVAVAAARGVPAARDDCDTIAAAAGAIGVDDAKTVFSGSNGGGLFGGSVGVDEAKTVFSGSNGGGLLGGAVNGGPLGGGIAGFGAGAGPFGGFGGGFGAGGGGGGGVP